MLNLHNKTFITLIRHGETTWNSDGRWQGQADVPLSPVGYRQAEQLARRLLDEGTRWDHLYASDLQRAWQTAAVLGGALDLPFHPLPALREVHLGVWSGLTTDEITTRYADQFAAVAQGGKRGEHGESDAEFRARVSAGLLLLVEKHPEQHLAVVTHGGTIRATVDHLIGGPHVPAERIANTSLSTIAYDGTRWHLLRFNDHRHLLQEPALVDSL